MATVDLKQAFSGLLARLRRPSRRSAIVFSVVTLAVVASIALYVYTTQESRELRAARKDFDETLSNVGKLYELPNETPQLATVTDLEKLQGQPFFVDAQNGDKVLVFPIASKVILYRPSSKKIINFSNITPSELSTQGELPTQVTASEQTPTPIPTPATPPTVTITNGTMVTGLTQKVQQQLEDAGLTVEVVARGNAGIRTYDTTVVVAVTPLGEQLASQIATELGVSVVALPEGETTPETDILIIAGTDVAASGQ